MRQGRSPARDRTSRSNGRTHRREAEAKMNGVLPPVTSLHVHDGAQKPTQRAPRVRPARLSSRGLTTCKNRHARARALAIHCRRTSAMREDHRHDQENVLKCIRYLRRWTTRSGETTRSHKKSTKRSGRRCSGRLRRSAETRYRLWLRLSALPVHVIGH